MTENCQSMYRDICPWLGCLRDPDWDRIVRFLMVISGLPFYHRTPPPLTGTSQTTLAWRCTTKTQHRHSAMDPDLPTVIPGWVLHCRLHKSEHFLITSRSCGEMTRFVAVKILSPASSFSPSYILFAFEGRNVSLPLVNLLRRGVLYCSPGGLHLGFPYMVCCNLFKGQFRAILRTISLCHSFPNISSNLFLSFGVRCVYFLLM